MWPHRKGALVLLGAELAARRGAAPSVLEEPKSLVAAEIFPDLAER
jgi:hypothetical protein